MSVLCFFAFSRPTFSLTDIPEPFHNSFPHRNKEMFLNEFTSFLDQFIEKVSHKLKADFRKDGIEMRSKI
jgi:hypothetical protein